MTVDDARRVSPAFARNIAPIKEALASRMQGVAGAVLEIGSGPGQHVSALAAALPNLTWIPSDPDPGARASIAAWTSAEGRANIAAPLDLDLLTDWSGAFPHAASAPPLAAVLAINVIHVAPWPASEGLVSGAGQLLGPEGRLFLYGPFARADGSTAPSNLAFDQSLRAQNPAWGLRTLEAIDALGRAAGFAPAIAHGMPSNNHLLELRRIA